MRYLPALIVACLATSPSLHAQSTLLESVKRNPEEAVAMCKRFRSLNKEGISANSKEAIAEISKQKNLSVIDAEILSIYVIGLNCPDVN